MSESDEQPWYRRHLWQLQPVRDGLLILLAYGLFHLGYLLSAITVPMLLALGLSYIVEPLIVALSRRFAWATRLRVVIGLLGAIAIACALLATLILPAVVGQTVNLAHNSGRYLERVLDLASQEEAPTTLRDQARHWYRVFFDDTEAEVAPAAETPADEATATPDPAATGAGSDLDLAAAARLSEERVRAIVADELARREAGAAPDEDQRSGPQLLSMLRSVGEWAFAITGGLIGVGIGVFLVVFFFVVFSLSWSRVIDFLASLIPPDQRDTILPLFAKMDAAVAGFVRGRVLIAGILALVLAFGWSLCGIPYAMVVGLVVGVFTLVPYLAGVGLIGAYGLLLMHLLGDATTDSIYLSESGIIYWRLAVFPALVFVVAQVLDDYLLTPLIQGSATNLSMAAIIVAVLAGGSLAGVYGMLLAIPVAACLKIALSELLWPKVQSWIRGEREDPLPFGGS